MAADSESMVMTIGFDMDGVIADRNGLKSDWAFEMFGVRVAPEDFTRAHVTKRAETLLTAGASLDTLHQLHNKITQAQYDELQREVYGEVSMVERLECVDGALEGLARVRSECADVGLTLRTPCITARHAETTAYGRTWLQRQGLGDAMPIISYRENYATKQEAILDQGCDAFVDDAVRHVTSLGRHGVRAIVLDCARNARNRVAADPEGVERVYGWPMLTRVLGALITEKAATVR